MLEVLELLLIKRLSITLGLKGYTPVALKELNTFLAVKLATQVS